MRLQQRGMTKEAFLKKLGQHVVQLREEAGLSQTELAHRCDKDRQNINKLEKGKFNPTAFYLSQIAAGLEVSVKDLFDFD